MLVLKRKSSERIQIGDHILVTVLQIGGHSVQIGIDAPREIRVVRTELQDEESQNRLCEALAKAGGRHG